MEEGENHQMQLARNSDSKDEASGGRGDEEELEAVDLILFHVKECYVYLIPPRKTMASYRADEWNVNKWHWEGALKVISKREDCIIRLEDRETGELFARAFLRSGEPHPVEPVIDSSRYFVLRVEDNIGGRPRHAFIGVGFRERAQAYDFQAALHDHIKYLNKKQTAEEMEQRFQTTSSVDYSLKEGETLVLQIKNQKGSNFANSAFFERLNKLSLNEKPSTKEGGLIYLKPPPAPPMPLSPISPVERSSLCSPSSNSSPSSTKPESKKIEVSMSENSSNESAVTEASTQGAAEDDFGDFQVA